MVSNAATEQDPPLVPNLVRRFLRNEYAAVDPKLPEWLKVLDDVGAGEHHLALAAQRLSF
jgi:hypothetical protein